MESQQRYLVKRIAVMAAVLCLACGTSDEESGDAGSGSDDSADAGASAGDGGPGGGGGGGSSASGSGEVTVSGSTECAASLDVAVSEPSVVASTDVDEQDRVVIVAANHDSTLRLDASLVPVAGLGAPREDTTYAFDATEVEIDLVTVSCDAHTFIVGNDSGETAAELPEVERLEVALSDWMLDDSIMISGGECGEDRSSACRLYQGSLSVRLDVAWQTDAGDDVAFALEARGIDGAWYEGQ